MILRMSQRALAVLRPALRIPSRGASTSIQHDSKALFKEINRLGSEGKWDAINNKPEMFLFGAKKKDAYGVYKIFNKSTNFFDSTPYGQILYLFWRLGLACAIIKAGCLAYETLVPEKQRLHYKYRHQDHGHDAHH